MRQGRIRRSCGVLGIGPDMIESYFKFYYPLHNGGIVIRAEGDGAGCESHRSINAFT